MGDSAHPGRVALDRRPLLRSGQPDPNAGMVAWAHRSGRRCRIFVSLLAGQGSALAMAGAYVLAHEMAVASPAEAFVQYHAKLAPLLRDKQRAAKRYAGWFAPSSRWGLWVRNRMSGLITWPIFAAIAARGFVDPVELPPPLPALLGESSAPR